VNRNLLRVVLISPEGRALCTRYSSVARHPVDTGKETIDLKSVDRHQSPARQGPWPAAFHSRKASDGDLMISKTVSHDAAIERVRALPLWQGPIRIDPLEGGLSNTSFKVFDADKAYVVRLGEDFPVHHVSRERETNVSRWAHAAGLSPKVIWSDKGILVCDFIAGHTYAAQDVRADMERVTALIRRCHTTMPLHATGAVTIFWVFHVIRDYLRLLEDSDHRIKPRLPQFDIIATELEAAQVALPIVFGHHDLLPANFIADHERLWLIDWEYGGFGTAMFDLANVSSNAVFRREEDARLLHLYFGGPISDALRRSFMAMKVASTLREALWAMVSEVFLVSPGVDYHSYGIECLTKFETVLDAYQTEFDVK
jgi:thiamine kinase-like enzyme